MPVLPITYMYLILMIADALCILLSLLRRDYDTLPVFVAVLPILFIGFSSNHQICTILCDGKICDVIKCIAE